jgi:uncharacterized protein (TIGR03085 family)
MAHLAVDERHALAETLRSADPDSATLCGDWTAAQLTAHIVLRERSVVELLGRLPNRRLHRLAQREIDALVAREPYERLVAAVADGPSWTDLAGPVPVAWVWSIPAVREQANFLEYLVHHEDVRRAAASWEPRALPAAVQRAVWKRLPGLTRLTMRALPLGVALVSPSHGDFRTGRARRAGVAVRITGEPVELALFAFGRHAVAQVDYDGSADDIATVRGARLGI